MKSIFFYVVCFVLGAALASLFFPSSYPTSFYVEPYGSGQYTVTLNVIGGSNVHLVMPTSFQNATDLANTLNKDMEGHWAHQMRGRQN